MRLAIPVTEGKVAAHFGHCSHFALFDVDEATKAIVKRGIISSPGHQPGFDEDPEKAVLDYITGELATGANICDH